MVLQEIIDKLDKDLPEEERLKKKSQSMFSMPSWVKSADKPWMGYGMSFIVFGVLLIVAFKYLMGFGF